MKNNFLVKKISNKNWCISYNKWRWIVIFTKRQIKFNTKDGFTNFKVVGECGYCIEVNSNCFECHLYKENVCCSAEYLKKAGKNYKDIPYLRYVFNMREVLRKNLDKPRWKEILADALTMRDTIKADKPFAQRI